MRSIYLLACLTSPLVLQAQSNSAPFQSVSGAFIALSVPDLAASTKWYTEKLGLRVVMNVPKQDKVGVTILEGGGVIVELIQHDDAQAASADGPQHRHGIFKAGFVVQDFDKALNELRARGAEVAYGPYASRAGQRANAIIRDNAGNLIQLFGQ